MQRTAGCGISSTGVFSSVKSQCILRLSISGHLQHAVNKWTKFSGARFLSSSRPCWSAENKEKSDEQDVETEDYHSIIKDTERGKGMCDADCRRATGFKQGFENLGAQMWPTISKIWCTSHLEGTRNKHCPHFCQRPESWPGCIPHMVNLLVTRKLGHLFVSDKSTMRM